MKRLILSLFVGIVLTGCSTVKPKLVEPTPEKNHSPIVKVELFTF